jgi:hypothetical protein
MVSSKSGTQTIDSDNNLKRLINRSNGAKLIIDCWSINKKSGIYIKDRKFKPIAIN